MAPPPVSDLPRSDATLRDARPRETSGSRLAAWALRAFDRVVPCACVSCGRGVRGEGPPICALCRSRMPALPSPRCPRCAEPVGTRPTGAPFLRCGVCEDWPVALAGADASHAFEGPAARVVRALKYDGWRTLSPWMGAAMVPAARRLFARLEWTVETVDLVPVPLSRSRERERGFNQARDLAVALAPHVGGRVAEILRRRSGGGSQARADAAVARRANVSGRFEVVRGPATDGRRLVIVDDVLTTGATVMACAEALAEAGFTSSAVVTFARTLRPLDERPRSRLGGPT